MDGSFQPSSSHFKPFQVWCLFILSLHLVTRWLIHSLFLVCLGYYATSAYSLPGLNMKIESLSDKHTIPLSSEKGDFFYVCFASSNSEMAFFRLSWWSTVGRGYVSPSMHPDFIWSSIGILLGSWIHFSSTCLSSGTYLLIYFAQKRT